MAVETGWTNGTPSLSGVTLGDGTIQMRYRRAAGAFFFVLEFIMGSTTDISSASPLIHLELPFPSVASSSGLTAIGITQASGDRPMGVVPCWAKPVAAVPHHGVAVAYESVLYNGENPEMAGLSEMLLKPTFTDSPWTSTAPFTWAEGDALIVGNGLESFAN